MTYGEALDDVDAALRWLFKILEETPGAISTLVAFYGSALFRIQMVLKNAGYDMGYAEGKEL
jgi:hypothetical protein